MACAEEADRGRRPKRETRESLMKLKFVNGSFISCDFQTLGNLFKPKCFREVFVV